MDQADHVCAAGVAGRVLNAVGVRLSVALAAMLSVALPAESARAETASVLSQTFIAGGSVESVPRAAWTATDGSILSASGRDAVARAPAAATRYAAKAYVFPTGTIFVYDFTHDRGGMLHAITDETALYVLAGEGSVEIAGERVPIKQGDVAAYPTGVLKGEGDAVIVAWSVTGTKPRAESRPTVVRAAAAEVRRLGYWPGPDGKRVVATTAEDLAAAPPNAIRLDLKTYPFDGNAVAVTTNYKGGPTNKTTGERDGLLYIVSGKMRFFQDDIDVIAGPGDAIRETAGRYHNWIRLKDSSFIGIGTTPSSN